jgi:hypothetical protein
MQRQGELTAKKCDTCRHSKGLCPVGERLTYKNCAIGMRVKAVWPPASATTAASTAASLVIGLDVPPGTLGIVKDYHKKPLWMTSQNIEEDDEDEESMGDDEDSDGDGDGENHADDCNRAGNMGVLSVLWDNRESRSIYMHMDHVVIVSH